MTTPINEVKVFCSYAHEDELLRNELEKHLATLWRAGNISIWHDRRILAGMDWAHEVDAHLNKADVILLLISPDFMASEYCNGIEIKRSLERHKKGEVRVIPIILRPVHWHQSPFGKLQALPTNAQPITVWKNQDQAFFDVAQGITTIVEQISPTSPPFTKGLDSRDGFSPYPRYKKRSSKVSGRFFFLTIGFLFLLLLGSVGFLYFSGIRPRPPFSLTSINTVTSPTNSATSPDANTPSATRQPTPTPPGSQLLYSDSLNSDRGEGWDTSTDSTGSCSFLVGYHVHSQAGSNHFCTKDKPLYSDFTISVDMNMARSSSAGILLRVSKVNSAYYGYFFEVTAYGLYGFSYLSPSGIHALKKFEFSSAINTGQNSLNTLKVVASGDKFAFYINGTLMNSPVQDSNYREGLIGFANFTDTANEGDVVFRNINVYAYP